MVYDEVCMRTNANQRGESACVPCRFVVPSGDRCVDREVRAGEGRAHPNPLCGEGRTKQTHEECGAWGLNDGLFSVGIWCAGKGEA